MSTGFVLGGAFVEPMQVDIGPEENENVEAASSSNTIRPVVEATTMDLEAYSSNYKGMARLIRLIHITDHCPALRIEGLRMVLNYVQQTYNTNLYQQIHKKLQDAINSHSRLPDAVAGVVHSMPALDTQWIESTSKKAAMKLERLDMDLKNYKSNSIKESIRRGHDDLGDHYLECGDLNNALKCYSRARDYCTSAKHLVNMCLNVIKVSVYLQNWSHVGSYVNKAESTSFLNEPGKDGSQQIITKLRVAAGLADLVCSKYKSAAKLFLLANLDHVDFPELLSPNNIATYGTLCALATFDRQELQRLVISSSTFKLFLELEPQLRDILYQFHDSKYASCLKLLDEIKDNLYLDVYLYSHVNSLYTQIRKRALCQYFSPYLSGDMHRMAVAFNTTVPALEDELMQLILDGRINARIDSHKKVLFAKDTDQRSLTFEKSLEMGEEFQKRAKALILRAAVIRSQIQVKCLPREGNTGGEMSLTPGNAASVRN